MSFCSNCGQELPEEANFCIRCGTEVGNADSSFQRKATYEGTLHKCPNCGEILDSFITHCPTCGIELRNVQSFSSVKQLSLQLAQIEAKHAMKETSNPFTQALSSFTKQGAIEKEKISLIRLFSIPNTKEDILEFIFFADANIDPRVYGINSRTTTWNSRWECKLTDAWLAKLEQVDHKAELFFGKTDDYITVRNIYENKLKKIRTQKLQVVLFYIILVLFSLLPFMMIIYLL